MKQIEKPNIDQNNLRVPDHVEAILDCGHMTVHQVLGKMCREVNASADEVNKATKWVNEAGETLVENENERIEQEEERMAAEEQRAQEFATLKEENEQCFDRSKNATNDLQMGLYGTDESKEYVLRMTHYTIEPKTDTVTPEGVVGFAEKDADFVTQSVYLNGKKDGSEGYIDNYMKVRIEGASADTAIKLWRVKETEAAGAEESAEHGKMQPQYHGITSGMEVVQAFQTATGVLEATIVREGIYVVQPSDKQPVKLIVTEHGLKGLIDAVSVLRDEMDESIADREAIHAEINAEFYPETGLRLVKVDAPNTTVLDAWQMVDSKNRPHGKTIVTYKDRNIEKIWLGNPAQGEQEQTLYIKYHKADGTVEVATISLKDFVVEAEFKRGFKLLGNGAVEVFISTDAETQRYLHFNDDGSISLDGIEEFMKEIEDERQATFELNEGSKSSSDLESRWGIFNNNEAERTATFESTEAARQKATEIILEESERLTKAEGDINDLAQKTEEKIFELGLKVDDLYGSSGSEGVEEIFSGTIVSGSQSSSRINNILTTPIPPNNEVTLEWGDVSSLLNTWDYRLYIDGVIQSAVPFMHENTATGGTATIPIQDGTITQILFQPHSNNGAIGNGTATIKLKWGEKKQSTGRVPTLEDKVKDLESSKIINDEEIKNIKSQIEDIPSIKTKMDDLYGSGGSDGNIININWTITQGSQSGYPVALNPKIEAGKVATLSWGDVSSKANAAQYRVMLNGEWQPNYYLFRGDARYGGSLQIGPFDSDVEQIRFQTSSSTAAIGSGDVQIKLQWDNIAPSKGRVKILEEKINEIGSSGHFSYNLLGATKVVGIDFDYNIVIGYGQSLSAGWGMVTEPLNGRNNALMLYKPHISSYADSSAASSANLSVLHIAANTIESQDCPPSCVAMNHLAFLYEKTHGSSKKFVNINTALGGMSIAGLMDKSRYVDVTTGEFNFSGATKSGFGNPYGYMLSSLRRVKQIADAEGKTCGVIAVLWNHGEADYGDNSLVPIATNDCNCNGNAVEYKKRFLRLQKDIFEDVRKIFGQDLPPTWLVAPVSGDFIDDIYTINQALIDLADNRNAFAAPSTYPVPNVEDGHPTGNGFRWYGEYLGKALCENLLKNEESNLMRAKKISIKDNQVTITCSVPVEPIRIETNMLAEMDDYGFALFDENGTKINISEINVIGNSIVITTENTMIGNVSVQYATYRSYGKGKTNIKGAGNICDSSVYNAFYTCTSDVASSTASNKQVEYVPKAEDGSSLVGKDYPMFNFLQSFKETILPLSH